MGKSSYGTVKNYKFVAINYERMSRRDMAQTLNISKIQVNNMITRLRRLGVDLPKERATNLGIKLAVSQLAEEHPELFRGQRKKEFSLEALSRKD